MGLFWAAYCATPMKARGRPTQERAAAAKAELEAILARRPDLKGKSSEAAKRIIRRETRLSLKPRSRFVANRPQQLARTGFVLTPNLPPPLQAGWGFFVYQITRFGSPVLKWREPSMPWHERLPRCGRRRKARSASARRRQCTVSLSR